MNSVLEDKGNSAVDMKFSFRAAFIDKAFGQSDIPKLTTVHIMYSDLVNYLMFKL